MMKSTMSASFTLTVVGFNSIATPARRTTTSRRAILVTSCLHWGEQSESNSGVNPIRTDRDPLTVVSARRRLAAGAARGTFISEYSKRQVNFGELGDS